MRRSILYAIVAVVVVVIIVSAVFLYRPPSATSPSSAPSTQSAATPTTTYLTVTTTISGTVTTTVVPYVIYPSNVVVFYSWWAGLERYGINAVVSAFENATGMQVENIQIPGTSSLYGLIISSLSAGLPPPPTFQQPTDPVQLVFIKLLPPNKWANYTEDAIKFGFLNNYTLPGIFGGVWVNVVNRTLYFPGLPSNMQTNSLIFYNRKLLETVEGGKITWIPVTTSQFLQLMQMAAEKGVPGLCQGGSDIWTFGYVFNDYFDRARRCI
ncbi:MAG: hypothetical protein TU35_009835 [Thermoproteus sp. AZ2]|jgi:glucose/arabinose transport system substrate-binding protein|uniref:Uncharacterized protein n=1 Tax=Thermoproteus sp. AZ2 TaxID=1609232 RepID=A0ACC6V426_9CREN